MEIGLNCLGDFLPELKRTSDRRMLINSPRPKKEYISLISQSGAFGNAALDYMAGSGTGISKFVSYGNRIDVDEATLIGYLRDDENKGLNGLF
ncbi:CoA-binding protein, partial [Candidatus Geothermarchaeota archaeon]